MKLNDMLLDMTVSITQLLYIPLNEELQNKLNIREKKEINNIKKLDNMLLNDKSVPGQVLSASTPWLSHKPSILRFSGGLSVFTHASTSTYPGFIADVFIFAQRQALLPT